MSAMHFSPSHLPRPIRDSAESPVPPLPVVHHSPALARASRSWTRLPVVRRNEPGEVARTSSATGARYDLD